MLPVRSLPTPAVARVGVVGPTRATRLAFCVRVRPVKRTCEHRAIDPVTALADLLRRLPSHPADQLDELLPDVWFAAHPSARRRPPLKRVPRGTRGSARTPSGASAPFYAGTAPGLSRAAIGGVPGSTGRAS